MKKLIIPIFEAHKDKFCTESISFGLGLAKQFDAEIEIVHIMPEQFKNLYLPANNETVYDTQNATIAPVSSVDSMVKNKIDLFITKLKIAIRKKNLDIPINFSFSYGDPGTELINMAWKTKADLILLTQNTENIFRHIQFETHSIPICIVPENFQIKSDIEKIVFATDYKETDEDILLDLYKLFDSQSIHYTSLHIDNKNAGNWDEMRMIFPDINVEFEVLKGDNICEEINDYISQSNANLLAINKVPKGIIDRMFNKSVSEQLLKTIEVPLIFFSK